MCGISGILGIAATAEAGRILDAMNGAIAHRGPDDCGTLVEPGVAFGQRRLSIIDLSGAGHQPMVSADGNLVLIFNGEIYNYRELKQQLPEYPFRTQTDTEVILAAWQQWGRDCVHRFNGMFAFAIWDRARQETFIFRDRLGIKPLYFYQKGDVLLFASEVRALLAGGLVPRKLNTAAFADYVRYQTVHAPDTMVQGVQMLLPGRCIHVRDKQVEITAYWSPEKNASYEAAGKSYPEVKKDIHNLLQQAVARRLVADVPFGAFLSGGIDSSAIVGLMSRVASQRVKTFAVTFAEEAFSEAKYAAAIAKKFDTDHTEIKLSPNDFLELIPAALQAMDHPSGDGPNTYVVSKVTREAGITMALSGLGGDELFGGYDVFKRMATLHRYQWLAALPLGMRRMAGRSLAALRPSVSSDKINELLSLPSWKLDQSYPITRQVLPDAYLRQLTGREVLESNRVQQIVAASQQVQEQQQDRLPLLSQVSVAEISTYMQNTLLRDTDQMSMAHALEVRVPFLDYELVEYVLGVPDKYKYPVSPKKLLTEALGDLLPMEIINRPKMGFVLPWQHWLKQELYTFADEKIQSLGRRGLLQATALQQLWQRFLNGDAAVTWSRVWALVVLENWMQENGIEV
ncbi:asparagine synthase (glutamine-hydrolyzing) [Pontibacter sp. 172403-2]|uniref:asparagine synthase (glutamine-hydrolyzing) n=1 Tax=Pontibacter rufus TaxID=2791028 RepID=UPI0018AFF757|nr:asparagine synthase (glutamine-hydrolyzing) [Pontibacter sp. 172403-2]MBF9253831.1 asparagine synthase (glutamine-hydrolyzing) [Pontibacter sp. 172403-2]